MEIKKSELANIDWVMQSGWIIDGHSCMCIKCCSRTVSGHIDDLGSSEAGFRWIEIHDMRSYSYYWSLNSLFVDYQDFLFRLESSVRSTSCEILVVGNFNAHYVGWGSRTIRRRQNTLLDFIHVARLLSATRVGTLVLTKDSALT